jgi:hypothetical protein
MPMSDQQQEWIVVPRWDEFQHRDAARAYTLTWIKTFTKLLSDDNYLALTPVQRAALHGIWLEYARSHRKLRVSTSSISRRLQMRVTKHTLEALNDAGFIHLSASNDASTPASAVAITEERREEVTPLPPLEPNPSHEPVASPPHRAAPATRFVYTFEPETFTGKVVRRATVNGTGGSPSHWETVQSLRRRLETQPVREARAVRPVRRDRPGQGG